MSVDSKILNWIESQLFEGAVNLGEDLPDDRELANIIKAGNNSTREALKRLEILGVLRLYEGKRKAIIPHLVSAPAESMTPALRLHMASARHPMRDMVQARIMIETWALAHARRDHPAMRELRELLDAMQEEVILPNDFHRLEVDFHIALTKLAGNHLVTGLMATMSETIYDFLLSLMGKVPLWSSTATRLRAEYKAIYDALESGDNELAVQLVKANIENQYADAGIDLDEATLSPNEMPGATAAMHPIEVEGDDLVPSEWDEPVSEDIISALENIGTTAPVREPATERPVAPEAPVAEPPAQPQATRSDVVTASGAPSGASTRRRRGTVSAPVHATVIKPIVRSAGENKVMVAAQKSQKPLPAEEPAVPETADEPTVDRADESVAPNLEQVPTSKKHRPKLSDLKHLNLSQIGAYFGKNSKHTSPEPAEQEPEQHPLPSAATEEREPQDSRTPDDVEQQELARQQRLAALTAEDLQEQNDRGQAPGDVDAAPRQEAEPERDTEQRSHTDNERLPEGYEPADRDPMEPEIIDETPHHRDSRPRSQRGSKIAPGQRNLISKKNKKKKKR